VANCEIYSQFACNRTCEYNTIHVVLNASKFCVVIMSYIDLSKTLNIKFTIDVLIHVSFRELCCVGDVLSQ